MINTKNELKYYLEQDKKALKITRKRPRILYDEVWKYQIILRKHEYYENTRMNPILRKYYSARHRMLGVKLGFEIPCNVFGPGLRINHFGYLVVNPKAKIGDFCDIHQGVNIGETETGAPTIGSHCWIGPGAKIFGGIELGSNISIGANAVVNKSFDSNHTIAGVPAKILK